FTSLTGTWQEQVVIPAQQVIPAPEGLSDEVACQAFVNPFTAYGMLEESGLQSGDWLLLTAGGSAFGKFALQLAKQKGIKTIVTVRRPDQVEALLALGAEAVVNTKEDAEWTKTVYKLTGDRKGVQAVFEAVGGEVGAQALSVLSTGGICLAYGLLSLQDTPINNGLLIFKNITVKGFWLTTWFPALGPERMQAVVQEILAGLATQSLKTDIEAVYPVDQIAEAVAHADRPGRSGKILLDLRS
ncbi:MAG: zinc-dependent alcohol dehydrogenase family protein, partial [Bacteroidota bacterium]